MADVGGHGMGLRERKKRRTRATLIDAAVELCLRQGYENTTVDQIAARADVSPRTFCRYFPTKDAVMMTLLEGLVEAVQQELTLVPPNVPVLQALRLAHTAVLRRVPSGQVPGVSTDRVVLMLQIINATPGLKAKAVDVPAAQALGALSDRMGVPVDHPRLRLVTAVWSSVLVTACGDLVTDRDGLRLGPELMAARIDAAWEDFTAVTAELAGGVPVGAR